jgi:hypothetical protein
VTWPIREKKIEYNDGEDDDNNKQRHQGVRENEADERRIGNELCGGKSYTRFEISCQSAYILYLYDRWETFFDLIANRDFT